MILTADIGTTALKISLFDGADSLLASEAEEYHIQTSAQGRLEFAPHKYWEIFCRCTVRCCEKTGRPLSRIEKIVVTTQGETLFPVDESGHPLHPAVVWLDSRARDEANWISARVEAETFYLFTGIVDCDPTCPLCKLLWFKQHLPEIYEKTYRFFLLEDYFLFQLTGRFVTEKSLLSTTGYFDLQKDAIWTDILELCGLDPAKIPEPLDCGAEVGFVQESLCREMGFSPHAVVYAGAMDQVCAALGAGNIQPGILTENTGTALVLGTVCDRSALRSGPRLTVYRHAFAGGCLAMPICMTGGLFLKWFKDEFCAPEAEQARIQGVSVYSLLDRAALQSPPLSKGLIAFPYLNGCLQPCHCPQAKGVFLGFGLEHTRGDFVRSILESVGYMLRENLELLRQKTAAPIRQIRSCGGGGNSELWCQIKADILNLPLQVPAIHETTSRGAALLAQYPRIQDAPPPLPKTSFYPRANEVSLYQQGYRQYQLCADTLYSLFQKS